MILLEVRENRLAQQTCGELLAAIDRARSALKQAGLNSGDRCVLFGPNSSCWVAADLAIMAEGGIVVPFYFRQAPEELVAMMKDCTPTLLVCANAELRQSITSILPAAPCTLLYDELFSGNSDHSIEPLKLSNDSPVTIIYTSGTSGDAKGVVLNAGNVSFMVQRTRARLEELMSTVVKANDDRVFHYLPFCFAGSWMLLLTCLARNNALMMSTDLDRLADELKDSQTPLFSQCACIVGSYSEWRAGTAPEKGWASADTLRKGTGCVASATRLQPAVLGRSVPGTGGSAGIPQD